MLLLLLLRRLLETLWLDEGRALEGEPREQ
jgi:hypothetical protein